MKRLLLIASFLFSCAIISHGQIIFQETFDEGDGSTSGTDDVGGVAWTSSCPYCGTSGDWNQIQGGALENQDSNGPAYWNTGDIDISSCTDGVTISVDLDHTGTLEPVTAGCTGCNSTDFVILEVSYDGGSSWNPYSDATYGYTGTGNIICDCGTCGSPDSNYPVPWCGLAVDGPTITSDDFAAHTFSDCISVGISTTVQLQITTMTWSGSETILVDNVTVACSSCALPVEIDDFTAERTPTTTVVRWNTLSESHSKVFRVQRSTDGVIFYTIGRVQGAVESNSNIDYQFIDKNPLQDNIVYYRLEQEDLNGKKKYSDIATVEYEASSAYYDGNNIHITFLEKPNLTYTINLYDSSGKLVYSGSASNEMELEWQDKGLYIIEIPEVGFRQKLAIM